MKIADFPHPTRCDMIAICPQCGSSTCDDNRIPDRLYVEAAQEAPWLRYEGRADEAINVLSALYAIRIANFIRPRWLCECGVQFDD